MTSCNLFQPERILVGGWAGLQLGARFLETVKRYATEYALTYPAARVGIGLGTLVRRRRVRSARRSCRSRTSSPGADAGPRRSPSRSSRRGRRPYGPEGGALSLRPDEVSAGRGPRRHHQARDQTRDQQEVDRPPRRSSPSDEECRTESRAHRLGRDDGRRGAPGVPAEAGGDHGGEERHEGQADPQTRDHHGREHGGVRGAALEADDGQGHPERCDHQARHDEDAGRHATAQQPRGDQGGADGDRRDHGEHSQPADERGVPELPHQHEGQGRDQREDSGGGEEHGEQAAEPVAVLEDVRGQQRVRRGALPPQEHGEQHHATRQQAQGQGAAPLRPHLDGAVQQRRCPEGAEQDSGEVEAGAGAVRAVLRQDAGAGQGDQGEEDDDAQNDRPARLQGREPHGRAR
ncbi:hypothetical protein STANM309S_06071 [Streptomyces tanashiensis]